MIDILTTPRQTDEPLPEGEVSMFHIPTERQSSFERPADALERSPTKLRTFGGNVMAFAARAAQTPPDKYRDYLS